MAEMKSRIGLKDANIAMAEVLRALAATMHADGDITIEHMAELHRALRQATETVRRAIEMHKAEIAVFQQEVRNGQ